MVIDDSCIQSQSCPVPNLTLNCKSLLAVLVVDINTVLYLVELLQLPEGGGRERERERERHIMHIAGIELCVQHP